MKFSSYTATATLALMSAFYSVAEARPSERQGSASVERATQMREDKAMSRRPNILAAAMVSRPVELWNANMKDALCRADMASIMPRVGSQVQQERRDAVDQVKAALTGPLTDKTDFTKNVGFTYVDIIRHAQERKIDYVQAKNMVDAAASAKLDGIRRAVSGLNCP